MDDAEAEAVLLALGGTLEWLPAIPKLLLEFHGENVVDLAIAPKDSYRVHVKRSFWIFHTYTAQHVPHSTFLIDFCPRSFKQRVAAKAACERHYATGQWE